MQIFSDKVYNVLKWMAMVVLPALAILVKGLTPIWNIPYGEPISDTIVLFNAFLGACLGVSTVGYNKSIKG